MNTATHWVGRVRALFLFPLAASLLLTAVLEAQESPWVTKAPMPSPRAQMAVAVVNGTLYVMGGVSGPSFFSAQIVGTLEAYDPATNSWTVKAPMSTARNNPAAGAVDGILYVVGGIGLPTPVPPLLSTVEAYDPKTDTWNSRAPMSVARSAMSAAVVEGILYVVGGTSQSVGPGGVVPTIVATLEAYDPNTNTWTTKAPMPTPRSGAAVGVVDGILYVVGGGGNEEFLRTVEAYDPKTDTWTRKAPMPTARGGMAAGFIDGRLYVIGGQAPFQTLNSVEAYDPKTNTWVTDVAPLPTMRSSLGGGVVDDVLYVVGGFDETPEILTVNEAFSPFLAVSIDIKPGDPNNIINLKSAGTVAVAILSSESFDATTVDPASVTLAGAPVARRGFGVPMFSVAHVDSDGRLDLLLKFRTQDLELTPTDTEAVLRGTTFSGQRIRGVDSIRVVPPFVGIDKPDRGQPPRKR